MATNDTLAGSYSGLVEAARHFVSAMTARLNAGVYPSGSNDDNRKRSLEPIQDATYISDVTQTPSGDMMIQVIVDSVRAPYALAYEYGSGIHATIGKADTYRIAPKTAKVLAFPWAAGDPMAALFSPKSAMSDSWKGRFMRSLANSVDGISNLDVPDFWFFNYVDHPGVEAKPFMKPTIQAEQTAIVDTIGKEMMKSIKQAIGEDVTFEVRF